MVTTRDTKQKINKKKETDEHEESKKKTDKIREGDEPEWTVKVVRMKR